MLRTPYLQFTPLFNPICKNEIFNFFFDLFKRDIFKRHNWLPETKGFTCGEGYVAHVCPLPSPYGSKF